MYSRPKVPWNNRLGEIGETEIRSRLSYFSIPVKYSFDVGIDFYCELLENSYPSISFYVQAKGTEHFDDNWGKSIKKSTITYWLDKLYPVYLIVYFENDDICYWISIEEKRYFLLEKMNSNKDTIYIKIDKSHILEKGKDKNTDFINKIRDDLVSIGLWQGRPIPKGHEYVKRMPGPPRSKIELIRSKAHLRMNISSLIMHYININDLKNAYICCDFLTKFDKNHYNHFVWFGQINKKLGKKEEAIKSYKEALEICKRDKKWPRDSMNKLISQIEKEMESIYFIN